MAKAEKLEKGDKIERFHNHEVKSFHVQGSMRATSKHFGKPMSRKSKRISNLQRKISEAKSSFIKISTAGEWHGWVLGVKGF